MADPQLPKRPAHPDFATLAGILRELDDKIDSSPTPNATFVGLIDDIIDRRTLVYVAMQRALRVEHLKSAPASAWIDAFIAGVLFAQKRQNQ